MKLVNPSAVSMDTIIDPRVSPQGRRKPVVRTNSLVDDQANQSSNNKQKKSSSSGQRPPKQPSSSWQKKLGRKSFEADFNLWDENEKIYNNANDLLEEDKMDDEGSQSTYSIKPRRKRSKRRKHKRKPSSHRSKKSSSKSSTPLDPAALLCNATPERTSSTKSYGTPETVPEEDDMEDDWFGEKEFYHSVDVIQKLRNKDITEVVLYVDDYDTATFQLVVEALLENNVLTAVKVYRLQESNNKRVRTDPEMKRVFSSMRALRNLEKLELCNMEQTELEQISSILIKHPTLTTFRLHLTHGGIDEDFIQALVGAPLLSDISLEVHKSFPLQTLFECKVIKHLSVDSTLFRFQDDHFVNAMQILENNDTLLTLDVRPRITNLGMRALAFAVDENKGLETLRFCYKGPKLPAGKMLLHLVHALTRNNTLQVVENHAAQTVKISSADETHIMELLESNQTIEELNIFNDDDCRSFKERLLRDNKDRKAGGKSFFFEWLNSPFAAFLRCGDECGEDFEEYDE